MLAFYAFAAQGITAISLILSSFVGSFAPGLYAGFASGNKQQDLLCKITAVVMVLAYIAAFMIFGLADSFVKLILPNYMRSAEFFRILALMIIPFAQYNISYLVAVAENKVLVLIKRMSVLLMVALLLNWLLYKYLGVNGIAWATVISMILAYFLASLAVSSTYRLWYLSLLFVPALIFNFLIVSYSMALAIIFGVAFVSVSFGILTRKG
jgi:O-antigen/teichoic acid export membrane protein